MAGHERHEAKGAIVRVVPGSAALSRPRVGKRDCNDSCTVSGAQNRIPHQHVADRRPTVNLRRRCSTGRDVRHIHEVVVMPVPDENRRCLVGDVWKQSVDRERVGADARGAAKKAGYARTYFRKRWIGEERRRKQHMPTVLDRKSRNPEERDRDQPGRVAAAGRSSGAPDSVRPGFQLSVYNCRRLASSDDNQRRCCRCPPELRKRQSETVNDTGLSRYTTFSSRREWMIRQNQFSSRGWPPCSMTSLARSATSFGSILRHP